MQIIGRSALRQLPVERAWRDVRTCSLMPPNPDRMQEILGRHLVEMETTLYAAG